MFATVPEGQKGQRQSGAYPEHMAWFLDKETTLQGNLSRRTWGENIISNGLQKTFYIKTMVVQHSKNNNSDIPLCCANIALVKMFDMTPLFKLLWKS